MGEHYTDKRARVSDTPEHTCQPIPSERVVRVADWRPC